MVLVGLIIWIGIMVGMLHLAVPSAEMQRDHTGKLTYYLLWILTFGGLLVGQYQFMTRAHQGHLAIMSDSIAIAIFTMGRVCYLRVYKT